MKADLHIHTNASKDCDSTPEDVLKYAVKAGMDCIAITDHDTIENAKRVSKLNNNPYLKIIVGSEITTNKGTHIIGLFIKKQIKSKDILSAIKEIKQQNGVVVLPHPFRRDCGLLYNHYTKKAYSAEEIKKIIDSCDIIEVANSKCKAKDMKKTKKYFNKYKKPYCAGSDAHFPFEIGEGHTILRGHIRTRDLKKELFQHNTLEVTYKKHSIVLSVVLSALPKIAHLIKKTNVLYLFGGKKTLVRKYEGLQKTLKKTRAKRAKKVRASV